MHVPTVKLVHNNYNTKLSKRSKTHSKTSAKTNGANFRLGRVILVAAKLQTVVYDILPSGGRCRKAVFGV